MWWNIVQIAKNYAVHSYKREEHSVDNSASSPCTSESQHLPEGLEYQYCVMNVVTYYLIESYSLFYGIYGRTVCDMYRDTN